MLRRFPLLPLSCILLSAAGQRRSRQGQGLAPAHAAELRQGPVQPRRRQQRRRARAVAPAQAAGNLDATHVWDVVEDRQGDLFAATGDEGKLFKVDGAIPASSVLHQPGQPGPLPGRGRPTARSTPAPGRAARSCASRPEGKAQVVADELDCLRLEPGLSTPQAKTLYAGTGPKGRIYKIDAEGKASVFYATKQEHILCLALGQGGTLYAGTDKGGLVYRIEPDGKGFVVFHAHQTEVRSLLVAGDGVYAGTAPVSRKSSSFAPKADTDGPSRSAVGRQFDLPHRGRRDRAARCSATRR